MSPRDGHLGDRAAALVDGALDGDARDRALGHIAGCLECRTEVDQQRRLKERLRRLSDPPPPTGLSDRLLVIGEPPANTNVADAGAARNVRPVVQPVPRSRSTRHAPVAAGRRPGSTSRPSPARAPATRPGRSRRLRRVTGSVGVLTLGMVAALTLGPMRNDAPGVSPPVGAYEVEHARTTGGVPGADPGAGAVVTVSVNR